MTGRARILGKRPRNLGVRRYGPISQNKTVHIISRTGTKTLCSKTPNRIMVVTPEQAREIESYGNAEFKGWSLCADCLREEDPSPDPTIWGPKRP